MTLLKHRGSKPHYPSAIISLANHQITAWDTGDTLVVSINHLAGLLGVPVKTICDYGFKTYYVFDPDPVRPLYAIKLENAHTVIRHYKTWKHK